MQLPKFAPIFAGLVTAACSASPSSPPPAASFKAPSNIGAGQGIDLAADVSENISELKGNRIDFVARYYRPPQSRWPALSPGEAQLLSAQGLKIVAVWEWHSRYPAHFTYSTGYDDATMAYWQARTVGQPAGSAIYFAVDFNAQSIQPIGEYFRGVAAGLTAANGGKAVYTIGVYGSGAVCTAIKQTGLARYTWLSNSLAWTDSIGYDDWNIRQGGRALPLSFNHDFDETRGEYGEFVLAGDGETAAAAVGPHNHKPLQVSRLEQAPPSALTPLR